MSLLEKLWKRGKDFLGVKYPVMSGGMTWISTFDLAKAVSEAGAFPVLAGGNMPPEMFEEEVNRCIAELKTPFAVNLITIAPNFSKHLEILEGKDVPFVVFAGSFPKRNHVKAMKDDGKKVLAFAPNDIIADQMRRYGVDGLIIEGSEAGGHIGHVALSILLQQILFNMPEDFPVFVAGGIATGKMAAHMLLMGAAGVQMGTRFVMSEECGAHSAFKDSFLRARAREAIATPQFDSRLPVVAVRGIKNRGMDDFSKLQLKLIKQIEEGGISREDAQYEVENFWIGGLRKAVVDGDTDYGSLMAGQSVGLMKDIKPIKTILEELAEEAEQELQRVKAKL